MQLILTFKLNLYLPLLIPFQMFLYTYTDDLSANPLIVCVFLCKYLSTYLFLTHIPTHSKCKFDLLRTHYLSIFQLISSLPLVNLTYTYPYLFHSRCFYKRTYTDDLSANPLIVCVFLCKYLSTYFFLTHIPTHNCKLNLYLPLPIPFQMLFSRNMAFFYFRSTLKSLGVILGGGLNIKVL